MNMQHEDASIAILIANGFNEAHITAVQRTLTTEKINHKIIAPEQGLVNGWRDGNWGHHYSVDQNIGTAMGSDYDCLIIIGGNAGVEKLKSNLHARRIMNHFLEAAKPIAAIGEGVKLLALSPQSAGLSVSAAEDAKEELEAANIEILEAPQNLDNAVLSSNGENVDDWINAFVELANNHAEQSDQQAA